VSAATFALGRRRRAARRRATSTVLAVAVLVSFALSLMIGHTVYGPGTVVRVLLGDTVPGASFTVGDLRLPRAVLGLLAGAAFGAAGVTFQTMLRNPLAAPDVIGISSGASAAAVLAIVTSSLGATGVSFLAVTAALATAALIYVLSYRDGVVGARLVLIGIGVAAMLDSVVFYALARAAEWDLQTAMRWLTGSLNGATWAQVAPVAVASAVFAPLLLAQARGLTLLQHGDDTASALGVRVERTRLLSVLAAVGLLAFATSAAGPIAFVSFLAGPVAARLVGTGGSLLVPSALVGAVLVLAADLVGQWAFGTRYPVGVVTGVLGAPYLVHLLISSNRAGGSS
jgi:iron complex transport system permease protein